MPTLLHTLANSVSQRVRRSPLYFERYNNTCDFATNRNYTQYAHECRAAYEAKHGTIDLPPSPLWENAATLVRGAFPADKARQYSAKLGELIERNDPSVTHSEKEGRAAYIKEPLMRLGQDLLDVFRSPEIHRNLLAFFRSDYRIEWIACTRSMPTERRGGSWLWHSDSFPPHTCKMFLHLTNATADTGATEFMNREDTMAYRRAGYFGQFKDERYAELSDFAKDKHLKYRPFHLDAAPGDVTIFDMNFFHRAVAPRTAFRDTVQFLLLPSLIPWDQYLEREGIAVRSKQSVGKLSSDPRKGVISSATPAMM